MVYTVTAEKNYIAFSGDEMLCDPLWGAQAADSVGIREKADTNLFCIFGVFICRVYVAAVNLDHCG